jgi:predicted ribosome quality control (RQC) complex YloA/Tae2 family protein
MHVDFLTLACLRNDLKRMRDARVQNLLFTDATTLAIELYAGWRTNLVLDVSQQHSRAFLTENKPRRGVETETPLLLLLRKYVRSARLRDVTQPMGERILEFHFEGENGRTLLVAEVMGKYSNLLLVDDDGIVLECVRRVTVQQNRFRATLPNHPYEPPPLLQRPMPHQLREVEWNGILQGADPDELLHKVLVRSASAVSPTVARELAARATGHFDAKVSEVRALALVDAADALFDPLESGHWLPHVALDEEGEVIAFAPYPLTQYEISEPVDSISEGIQRYFAQKLDTDAYAAVRQRVNTLLAGAQKEVDSRLYQLRSQLIDPAEVEALRESGEILLSYQWQVPKGANVVELPDFTGKTRRITLEPTLNPVDNAKRYFARYDKRKKAADELPPLVESAEQDSAYLAELANDLNSAEERPEIDAVREALMAGGFTRGAKKRRAMGGAIKGPRRVMLGDYVALVGRNAKQNDEVTFKLGSPDDLWLHARGVPGSHVILKTGGRTPPTPVLDQAAALAGYYSQARGNTDAAIDVTERRQVRRISGARPGLVTYRNERTLYVRPRAAEEVEDE